MLNKARQSSADPWRARALEHFHEHVGRIEIVRNNRLERVRRHGAKRAPRTHAVYTPC